MAMLTDDFFCRLLWALLDADSRKSRHYVSIALTVLLCKGGCIAIMWFVIFNRIVI